MIAGAGYNAVRWRKNRPAKAEIVFVLVACAMKRTACAQDQKVTCEELLASHGMTILRDGSAAPIHVPFARKRKIKRRPRFVDKKVTRCGTLVPPI
jgi:hypothetical protein